MVGSVSNGIPQQIPAANTFKPGESTQEQTKATAEEKKTSPSYESRQQESAKTQANIKQTTENFTLSRENTRPDPQESSPRRGSTLDINV